MNKTSKWRHLPRVDLSQIFYFFYFLRILGNAQTKFFDTWFQSHVNRNDFRGWKLLFNISE